MSTQGYQLHIDGLQEAEGQIKAADLRRVLDALITTAERATRLMAMGEGSGKGPKPQWLSAAIDFTVTGLKPGSTALAIEAPQFREIAYEQFAQQDILYEQPDLDSTALDVAAMAIKETQTDNPAGDHFDSPVLGAILKFEKAIKSSNIRYELTAQGSDRRQFMLKPSDYAHIAERLNKIPPDKAYIVSGQLNEMKHGDGRFGLLLNDGSTLFGRLDRTMLDIEALRPLWGKETTVEGMVHFKVSGQPRLIEARRIGKRLEGDSVFEEKPSVEKADSTTFLSTSKKAQPRSFDPMKLWGLWPGSEPIEELLSQLD